MVDLMTGSRQGAINREIVLSYVRNARFFARATEAELIERFPELSGALASAGEPPREALARLHDLHRRHGAGVTAVMERELDALPDPVLTDSLLALNRAGHMNEFNSSSRSATPAEPQVRQITLLLRRQKKEAEIVGVGVLKGAVFKLIDCLASHHLAALADGLPFEDMPCITAADLAEKLQLADEGGARRSVKNVRNRIAKAFERVGWKRANLIETIHPYG